MSSLPTRRRLASASTLIAAALTPLFASAEANLEHWYCADDVLGQIEQLSPHAAPMGFHLGAGVSAGELDLDQHIQSIARLPGPGPARFFVSKNGNPFVGEDVFGNRDGLLALVDMASRPDSGERVRSNRLAQGVNTDLTPPDEGDRIIAAKRFLPQEGLPEYRHPGGIHITGNVMAVALTHPEDPGDSPGLVILFDITDPMDPVEITRLPMPYKVHNVALAPWQGGWLLVAHGGFDDTRNLTVRYSFEPTLDANSQFFFVEDWHRDQLVALHEQWWPDGFDGFQTINLVPQCDGRLFLVGSHITIPMVGDHKVKVYEVLLDMHGAQDFELLPLTDVELSCYSGHDTVCNFAAGVGTHVTPTGEITLYATEHHDAGPYGSVRMAEFTHQSRVSPDGAARLPTVDLGGPYEGGWDEIVVLNASASQPAEHGPWFDLAALDPHTNMSTTLSYDRVDEYREDWHNLDAHQQTANEALAVTYEAPVGCDLALYSEPNYNGDQLMLEGTGERETVSLFDHGWEFQAQSVRYEGQCNTLTFEWDLDDDGVYDSHGAVAQFNTSGLADGGHRVRLRVCDGDACVEEETTVFVFWQF